MAELSIGQVAQRAGIAASAIRFYESEGLIAAPPRKGGRRVYDEKVVERLALIDLAKKAGFTIGEIKRLLGGFARRTPPGKRWRTLAEKKLAEMDRRIEEAHRIKQLLQIVMGCQCPTIEDCARALRD